MSLCLFIWCLVAVQPEASSSDVKTAESALSQPSDETATPPADEAGQIVDASRLIVGDNTSQARRIGVRTLLRIGSPAAIERLTVILTQPNEGNGAARAAICGALAETESPPTELLEPLIGLIGESRGSALDGVQGAL